MSAAVLLKTSKIKSSTEKQSSAIHHRPQTKAHSNEYENNTHKAEQALLAWRGAGRSSRGTRPVPVADVFPCGVCCCIAEIILNKIINRKTEQLCHHRPQTKAHSNEYENNTHKAEQALPAWRGAGRSSRGRALFQNFRFFLLDLCVGTAPQNMGTAPGFWRALPLFGDKTFPKYV